MDTTARVGELLRRFHLGQLGADELAFGKALTQARLDYTPASLARVDALLAQLRQSTAPHPASFLEAPQQRTFMHLLAAYMGLTIARYLRRPVRWFTQDELPGAVPAEVADKLPQGFSASLSCEIDQVGLLMPVAILEHQLFAPTLRQSVVEAADTFLERDLRPPLPWPLPAGASADAGDAEILWRLGHVMGNQAALLCQLYLEADQPVAPHLLHQGADAERCSVALAPKDGEFTIEDCRQRLAEPDPMPASQRLPVASSMAYMEVHPLPEFYSAALVLEGRWHATARQQQIMLPFRAPSAAAPFAIHAPRASGAALGAAAAAALSAGFHAGLAEVAPGDLWARCFVDESNPANLTARDAQALQQVPEAVAQPSPAPPHPFAHIHLPDCLAAMDPVQREAVLDAAGRAGDDPVSQLFAHEAQLLRTGSVIWGALVQANNALFSPGPGHETFGAVFVLDPSGLTPPDALAATAKRLFALRQQIDTLSAQHPAPEALLRIAHFLDDERTPLYGLPVPEDFASGGLLVTTTFVERWRLPHHRLIDRCIPLMMSAEAPERVLPLDKQWWPEFLSTAWEAARPA